MKTDLLEELAQQLDCNISDLRFDFMQPRISDELKKMDPQTYPLLEWNKTAHYIIGVRVCFETIEKAKCRLQMNAIRNK